MWATRAVTLEFVLEASVIRRWGFNNEVEGLLFSFSRAHVDQQMLANKRLDIHPTAL